MRKFYKNRRNRVLALLRGSGLADKLTILEQKYPDCGSKSGDGESVDAESAGMTKENSELTKFPSFTA